MISTNHAICKVTVAPLRSETTDRSEMVSQLLFGDYVEVLELDKPWIRIRSSFDSYEGWMDFKQLHFISQENFLSHHKEEHPVVGNSPWILSGAEGEIEVIAGSQLPNLRDEKLQLGDHEYRVVERGRRSHFGPIETTLMFLNVPYLWGGRSKYGIDCSGLVQTVARIHGISTPRDASAQVNYGETIDFEERRAGDLPFFINENGLVHHVGVLNSTHSIVHASGWVREDKFDENGIFLENTGVHTHTLHSIKRWFAE
jgi:gamma-D-glutamyl-L-lysine dipeptidyl-peptidase